MVGVQTEAPQVPMSWGEVRRAKYSKARRSCSLVAGSSARDGARPFWRLVPAQTPLTGQTHTFPRRLQRAHEGLTSLHFRCPALHLKQPLRDLVVPKRRRLVGSRLMLACGGWHCSRAYRGRGSGLQKIGTDMRRAQRGRGCGRFRTRSTVVISCKFLPGRVLPVPVSGPTMPRELSALDS